MRCEYCGDIDGFHREDCSMTLRLYKETFWKHWELVRTIKMELKNLEPWYSHGRVGNPMDAVMALRNIHKAVNS